MIRDAVRSILLTERIRSKTFDINEFKKFDHFMDALTYARENLRSIGIGTDRQVFLLSSRFALKIVTDEGSAIDQNLL